MKKAATPILFEELINRAQTLFGQRLYISLKRSSELSSCQYRYSQIAKVYEIFSEFDDIITTKKNVQLLFGISRRILTRSLEQARKSHKNDGRPKSLTDIQEKQVLEFIKSNAIASTPLSQCEVLDFILENFQVALSYGWMTNFLKRYQSEVIPATAIPQDGARLSISPDNIHEYINILKAEVAGIYMDLIYNFDEMGSSERHESKSKDVLVPADMKGQSIHYSIKRNQKNQTLVACINAGGDTVMPMIIDHRTRIQSDVISSGLRKDEDVMLRSSSTGFVNEDLIIEWLKLSVLKHVQESRTSIGNLDSPAVMFSDNCSSHTTDSIKKLLGENLIKLITFPSNSTGLFQMLDLVTFGIVKRRKKTIRTEFIKNSQADQINKLIQAFEQATTGNTNRKTFSKAGIKPNTSNEPYTAIIDENEFTKSCTIQEILTKSENSKNSTNLTRTTQFGFINKQYFEEELKKRLEIRKKKKPLKSKGIKYHPKPKIPKISK